MPLLLDQLDFLQVFAERHAKQFFEFVGQGFELRRGIMILSFEFIGIGADKTIGIMAW